MRFLFDLAQGDALHRHVLMSRKNQFLLYHALLLNRLCKEEISSRLDKVKRVQYSIEVILLILRNARRVPEKVGPDGACQDNVSSQSWFAAAAHPLY